MRVRRDTTELTLLHQDFGTDQGRLPQYLNRGEDSRADIELAALLHRSEDGQAHSRESQPGVMVFNGVQ
jgi:hypothetical protein